MTEIPTASTPPMPRLGIPPLYMAGLGVALLVVVALSLTLGSVRIPLEEVITILLGGDPARNTWRTIILSFRLPKVITALLAGAALAVSGLQMQTLFRNPLAGPFELGISAGASLGVAVVVLSVGTSATGLIASLGLLGNFGIVVAASSGSALVLFAVMAVARHVNTMTLLILGLLVGYAINAFVNILLSFAIPEQIQSYIAWTFGSFGGVTWSQLAVLAPTLGVGLVVAWASAKPLNALLLGETYARSLGLSVQRARFWLLLSTSVLAGAVTAFCGPITFLGVAVPHLCRVLFNTSDHRILVPATMLLGAIIAVVADLVAQLPGSQYVLPLNAVTSLLGAPVVAWIILRQRNLRSAFGE